MSTPCFLFPTSHKFSLPTSTVGLSDLVLFSIFENLHVYVYQVYFKEFNSKRSAISARAAHALQSFFFINTGTLQKIFFFWIWQYLLFTPMNTRQKRKLKIKIFKHFILGPQMGKLDFDLDRGKNKMFWVFLHFCF